METPKPRITLYNLDVMDFLKKVPERSIDILLTDPPYFLRNRRHAIRRMARRDGKWQPYEVKLEGMKDWDAFPDDKSFLKWYYAWLDAAIPKLKASAHVVLFVNDHFASYIRAYLERKGFRSKNTIYWIKTTVLPQPADAVNMASAVEMALWMVRGHPTFTRGKGRDANYIETPVLLRPERITRPVMHPTQKPLAVIEWILAHVTSKETAQRLKTVVMDPFMGVGTTPLACKRMGMNAVGNDKNADYYTVACKRPTRIASQISNRAS